MVLFEHEMEKRNQENRIKFTQADARVDRFIAQHDLVVARTIAAKDLLGWFQGVTIADASYFESVSSCPAIRAKWDAEAGILATFHHIDYDWWFTAYYVRRQGFDENACQLNRLLLPHLRASGMIPREPVIHDGMDAQITYGNGAHRVVAETPSHLTLRGAWGQVREVAKEDPELLWDTLFYTAEYTEPRGKRKR